MAERQSDPGDNDAANRGQITELLTNYGPIAEFWFDMGGPTADQSGRMAQWVHDLQPATMVHSRVWNDKGDFEVGGDNRIPNDLRMGPWESILSVFPQCWSYCSTYKADRAPENLLPKSRELVWGLVRVIAGGGQFAYNIGPKGDGSIDPFDKAVLDNAGAWMRRHPDAITGARPTWFPTPTWGRVTANGSALYLHVNNWADGSTITLPGLANQVTSVVIDGTDQKLEFSRNGLDLSVELRGVAPDELMPVLKVALDGEPTMVPAQTVSITGQQTVIAPTDVVGRNSAKGVGNSALDAYVLNSRNEKVALGLDVSVTSYGADTIYRVWVGDRSVELTGAQLLGSQIDLGSVLAVDTVDRIRIEYADPVYYADALNLSGLSITVTASTASEALTAIRSDLAARIAAGEVAGPIAKQLTDSLAKAEKHIDGGRTNAAMSALDKVIRHLENPKKPDTLTAEAAASLRLQASTLQDLIG